MSKAEVRALEYYPIIDRKDYPCKELDEAYREVFSLGYHQAEKDLELTWEDLATIEKLGVDFIKQNHTPMSDEEFYKEILKRFKERKSE
ncbi:MAG: hypothetical protein UHS32_01450 [Bacteroidaceae bacterium]|nr:hypothetical protein [Bacteroidaceae bacterium]